MHDKTPLLAAMRGAATRSRHSLLTFAHFYHQAIAVAANLTIHNHHAPFAIALETYRREKHKRSHYLTPT